MGEHQSIGCFHCGLPVPKHAHFEREIDDQLRQFCCSGCENVAALISGQGLGEFYQRRTANADRAIDSIENLSYFDNADLQTEFVSDLGDRKRAELLVQGITCTACVWLIEKVLRDQQGVVEVSVHSVTHRLLLTYKESETSLSSLMAALYQFGYRVQPWRVSSLQKNFERDKRKSLKRIGLAGFGMMQVGMVAIALYAGGFQGIDDATRNMLNWVKALMATPVVFYSALPFFVSALRALKAKHLNMDVPVALAIGGAYIASVVATLTASGEVYFDAVMMFTFFLLIGRHYEHQSRHRNLMDDWRYRAAIPDLALVKRDAEWAQVPSSRLIEGDHVRVVMGDQIAADGVLLQDATIDESIFSGESEPILKRKGDQVFAGTNNLGDLFEFVVTHRTNQSQLSKTNDAADLAHQHKPKWVTIADKVAAYFVAAVILISVATFAIWFQIDSSRAFWVALSVLVATCPCALSLATPTVLAAAVQTARRHGLLVRNSQAFSLLSQIDEIVFDKTGTLTDGQFSVTNVEYVDESIDPSFASALINTLEQHSRHPIAIALRAYFCDSELLNCDVTEQVGCGVEATIDGDVYRLGRADWALNTKGKQGIWLSCNGREMVQLFVEDRLRDDAQALLKSLADKKIKVTILSGDLQDRVDQIAKQLDVGKAYGDQRPGDKREYIAQRQQQGAKVAMVGDGLNDIEVLAQADTSVVVGDGVDLVVDRGDVVVLNHRLSQLIDLLSLGRQTRRLERQNIAWALSYNLSILPAAAAGLVAPWAAAIGMSLSSVLVVANALRIKRFKGESGGA